MPNLTYVLYNIPYKDAFLEVRLASQAYSELSQTTKIKLFAKIVIDRSLLTIFARSSILDIWQGFIWCRSIISEKASNVWDVPRKLLLNYYLDEASAMMRKNHVQWFSMKKIPAILHLAAFKEKMRVWSAAVWFV